MDVPDNAVPKVHPATRPVEPEDPMNLHGTEVPGDPELMLRILVEEYARMGFGPDVMMQMFRDPEYQAPYGLWRLFGDEELFARIVEILGGCGIFRTTIIESVPELPEEPVPFAEDARPPDQPPQSAFLEPELIQIQIPDTTRVSHATKERN